MCKLQEGPVSTVNVKTGYIHTPCVQVFLRSSYIYTSWEVAIMTSGAFKSFWSEQDGGAPSLN